MKKLSIIIAFLVLIGINTPSLAFEFPKFELPKFKKVDSVNKEIKTLLYEHSKAMDEQDIEKLRSFYDKDYISEDGFNLDDLIEMLEKNYAAFGSIKYKTKINNISYYDNWALVQISDESIAEFYPEGAENDKSKMGVLKGRSVYNLYLKKDKENNWKIFRDDILMEDTSLKYGVANDIDINLITPVMVKGGEHYDLSLKMNKPDDIVALGSISREEITYPPKDYPEKFRKIPQEGELERVVLANKKNLDEYAVASIGFTKISMNEELTKARVQIVGMAYLLKRVNVDKLSVKTGMKPEIKTDKI